MVGFNSKLPEKDLGSDLRSLAARFDAAGTALLVPTAGRLQIGEVRECMAIAGAVLLRLLHRGLLIAPSPPTPWLRLSMRRYGPRPKFDGFVERTSIGIVEIREPPAKTCRELIRHVLETDPAVQAHPRHRAIDLNPKHFRHRQVLLEALHGWLRNEIDLQVPLPPPIRRVCLERKLNVANAEYDMCFDLLDENDTETVQFFVSVARCASRACTLLAARAVKSSASSPATTTNSMSMNDGSVVLDSRLQTVVRDDLRRGPDAANTTAPATPAMQENRRRGNRVTIAVEKWRTTLQAWRDASPGLCYSDPSFWLLPPDDTDKVKRGWVRSTTWTNPLVSPPRPGDEVNDDGFVAVYHWSHERLLRAGQSLAQVSQDLAEVAESLGIDSGSLQMLRRALSGSRAFWHPLAFMGRQPEGLAPDELERRERNYRAVRPEYFEIRDRLIPDVEELLIGRLEARAKAAGPGSARKGGVANGGATKGRRRVAPHQDVLGTQSRTRLRRLAVLRVLPADSNSAIVAALDEFGEEGPDDSTVSKDLKAMRASGAVHPTKLERTRKGDAIAKLTS